MKELHDGLSALLDGEPDEPDWPVLAAARSDRRRRRRLAAQAAGVIVVLAAAVGLPLGLRGSGAHGPSVSAGAAPDPTLLVREWHVDAPDEEKGAILRLGDDLSLWRRCGMLGGAWDADRSGDFVASLDGGDTSCSATQVPEPSWLARAAGYRVDGARVLLTDDAGSVVATLTPSGRPTAPPGDLPSLADPPTPDAKTRAELADPVVPAGLTPVSTAQASGTWWPVDIPASGPLPSGKPPHQPFLRLVADGSWTALNGCAGDAGRWRADAGTGALVTAGGSVAAVACDGMVDTFGTFLRASGIALDGPDLVLLGPRGNRLGTFARHPDAADAVPAAVKAGLVAAARSAAEQNGGRATDIVAVRTTTTAVDRYVFDTRRPTAAPVSIWLVQFFGTFDCTGCGAPAGAPPRTPASVIQLQLRTSDFAQIGFATLPAVPPLSALGDVVALGS